MSQFVDYYGDNLVAIRLELLSEDDGLAELLSLIHI